MNQMEPGVIIRQAVPTDARQAVLLLHQAISSFGESIFGNGDREKTIGILERLFVADRNRFNYRYVHLLEKEKQISGLLLAFRSNLMIRLNLLTGKSLVGILKPVEMIQLVKRVIKQSPVKEGEKDEYYISDLAVAPHLQGQRIGTQLLAFAEEQAGKMGLSRCSLVVTHENEGAKRLYLRHGYRIINFIRSNPFERLQGRMGYYRMTKEM
jgi:ribosomal protein S18 acetylase RimI-like enzyme